MNNPLIGAGILLFGLTCIAAIIGSKPKPATVTQLGNRLIEFIDVEFLPSAMNHFNLLIQNGLTPEHAFATVISQSVL